MRFVVVGAGAIGGVVGGRLFQRGHDVVLVARGAHHDAIRDRGLTIQCPTGEVTLAVPVVDRVGRLELGADDVVLLAVKSQDTAGVVAALDPVAPPGLAVVSLQNGLENERVLLRHFDPVYGVCVMFPATHVEPGVVQANSTPVEGLLDLGRYPAGGDGTGDIEADPTAEAIAAAFRSAGFESEVRPDIVRWKAAKLLLNLANAVDAVCGLEGAGGELYVRAQEEGRRCLAAAGIDHVSEEQDAERRGDLIQLRRIDGQRRVGSSGRQSLARQAGAIEVDYLNGEIVLLGRLHGVPTPVNELLRRLANECARERRPPASMAPEEVLALLDAP
ncbi:MAG: 2-dehydropantoate 2-reductase [Acidimicrobiales bacterium]|nr:2-dehydropantoate 2-reductase [Acidimicrobiales bacterium]